MTQKIQHRLGNYHVLGLLSYGSTSHVFKIRESSLMSYQQLPEPSQSQFELVTIDMTYYRQQNVQKNILTQQPKKDLILKLYNLERMVNKNSQLLDEVKYDILVQIIFLTYLQHPGIVQAKQMLLQYEIIPSKDVKSIERKLVKAGIVMQICQKGCFNSICNYINRTKVLKQNKPKIMQFYLSQVANTLMYLNKECKILHRDLKVLNCLNFKAQNIMVNKELDIKVIDYGVSKINIDYLQKIFNHPQKQAIFNLFGFDLNVTLRELYNQIKNNQTNRKNLIGSKHYISPQLVQKYRSDMQMIDQAYEKTDIWSLGVLIYKIFHDKYPFDGRNLRQTLDFIVDEEYTPQINADLPQQVKQVILKCLTKDYSQRPGWDELIKCKFFQQIPQQEIFLFESPIVSLLQEHKKQKSHIFQNAQNILFDERLILKYEDQSNKKRRVLILKQKSKENYKMLILKQKQSVSFQIQLTDSESLNIRKNQNYLEISFFSNQQENIIKIFYENSKQTVEKLIDSINQVFRLLKEKNDEKQKINQESNENHKNEINGQNL